jgi:hypothetical protein
VIVPGKRTRVRPGGNQLRCLGRFRLSTQHDSCDSTSRCRHLEATERPGSGRASPSATRSAMSQRCPKMVPAFGLEQEIQQRSSTFHSISRPRCVSTSDLSPFSLFSPFFLRHGDRSNPSPWVLRHRHSPWGQVKCWLSSPLIPRRQSVYLICPRFAMGDSPWGQVNC